MINGTALKGNTKLFSGPSGILDSWLSCLDHEGTAY